MGQAKREEKVVPPIKELDIHSKKTERIHGHRKINKDQDGTPVKRNKTKQIFIRIKQGTIHQHKSSHTL